jgi:hypothetical protein
MAESISFDDAHREFFLGIYRSAVDFYKPRIEKKTGVSLGDIAVWDSSRMPEYTFRRRMRRWLVRALRQLIRQAYPQFRSAADDTEESEWARKCSAAYYNNGIYISFRSGTVHEEAIAAVVVHELAHALWERVAAKPLTWQPDVKVLEKYALFVEGFATYAERVWFLDLYPLSVRSGVINAYYNHKGVHYRGMRLVERLVREKGSEILLEIPKQWRNLP